MTLVTVTILASPVQQADIFSHSSEAWVMCRHQLTNKFSAYQKIIILLHVYDKLQKAEREMLFLSERSLADYQFMCFVLGKLGHAFIASYLLSRLLNK